MQTKFIQRKVATKCAISCKQVTNLTSPLLETCGQNLFNKMLRPNVPFRASRLPILLKLFEKHVDKIYSTICCDQMCHFVQVGYQSYLRSSRNMWTKFIQRNVATKCAISCKQVTNFTSPLLETCGQNLFNKMLRPNVPFRASRLPILLVVFQKHVDN